MVHLEEGSGKTAIWWWDCSPHLFEWNMFDFFRTFCRSPKAERNQTSKLINHAFDSSTSYQLIFRFPSKIGPNLRDLNTNFANVFGIFLEHCLGSPKDPTIFNMAGYQLNGFQIIVNEIWGWKHHVHSLREIGCLGLPRYSHQMLGKCLRNPHRSHPILNTTQFWIQRISHMILVCLAPILSIFIYQLTKKTLKKIDWNLGTAFIPKKKKRHKNENPSHWQQSTLLWAARPGYILIHSHSPTLKFLGRYFVAAKSPGPMKK